MASAAEQDVERAAELLRHLSGQARQAALSYLEYLAFVEESEPPLSAEERDAIVRFRRGDVSGLVPADQV